LSVPDLAEIYALRSMILNEMSEPDDKSFGDVDQAYIDVAYKTPQFDWQNWNKGLQGLKNAGVSVFVGDEIYDAGITSDSFVEFDVGELMQLLLMIDRVNRFVDGFYDQQIENGIILKILDQFILKADPSQSHQ
jgi:hypothetical protein